MNSVNAKDVANLLLFHSSLDSFGVSHWHLRMILPSEYMLEDYFFFFKQFHALNCLCN